MREIKFRGVACTDVKTEDGSIMYKRGELIYGNLCYWNKQPWIIGDLVEVDDEYTILESWIKVEKGTESQYTGLKDKNNVEIYENDDIRTTNNEWNTSKKEYRAEVKLIGDKWVGYRHGMAQNISLLSTDLEVIGNNYENKKLKGATK